MPMKYWLAALAAALMTAEVLAEPLHDQDNGPVSGIYNFVESTEGARLLPKGRFGWSLSAITSSHAISTRRGDEALVFDGETTRAELRFRYGLGERVEVGVELPYVWHSPGQLDSLIDTWHDWFGLPGGSRENRASDILQFTYENANGLQLDYRESSNGIGDARFQLAYRLGDLNSDHARALRFGATAPTGDADLLHGSGAPTFSIGYAGDVSNLGDGRLNAYYRLHATWLGEPDVLAANYNEWIGHVAGGLGYRAWERVEFRVQAAARTATHDSDLVTLGEPSVILTVGGNIRLSQNYDLMLAVGEDIKVNSSPDVSFQLALRYRPGD